MNVREIIAALQAEDPETEVYVQGTPWSDGSFDLDPVEWVMEKTRLDPTRGLVTAARRTADGPPVLMLLNRHACEN